MIIEGPDGALEIKLDAGQAVIYPATTLHHVAQVTRGTRLAAFGWVRSLIRRSDQREILFDLDLGCRQVFESEGKTPLHDRLAKARNNLVHLWVED